jgi:hypothetical protein
LCQATETKILQHEATDFVIVEALPIRLGALRHLHELMNAFPPEDQQLAAQIGVKVIVNDAIPRPDLSQHRNIAPPRPTPQIGPKNNGSGGNGAAPARPPGDPRPID